MTLNADSGFDDIIFCRCSNKLVTEPALLGLLRHSYLNENYLIFRTALKKPIGYVAWISVTKETIRFIEKNITLPLYTHELNEGFLIVIYDVVFVSSWSNYCKREFIKFLKNKPYVGVLRNNEFKSWFRFKGKTIRDR